MRRTQCEDHRLAVAQKGCVRVCFIVPVVLQQEGLGYL